MIISTEKASANSSNLSITDQKKNLCKIEMKQRSKMVEE